MSQYEPDKLIVRNGVYYPRIVRIIKKSANPFRPIFEALVNCFEAVTDLSHDLSQGRINIRIHFTKNLVDSASFDRIEIDDNGIGFDEINFERFLTFGDDRKGYDNKGSGRIQLLHSFGQCDFESIYRDQNEFRVRRFSLSKSYCDTQPSAVVFYVGDELVNSNQTGTVLTLRNINENDKPRYEELSAEEMKQEIIKHFFLFFCVNRSKLPQFTIESFVDDENVDRTSIEIADIPEADDVATIKLNYSTVLANTGEVIHTDRSEDFEVSSFKLPKRTYPKNEIRLTSKGEVVEESRVHLQSLAPDEHIDGYRYVFLVKSGYLEAHESDTRGELHLYTKQELTAPQTSLFSSDVILIDDINSEVNRYAVEKYQEIRGRIDEHERDLERLQQIFQLDEATVESLPISVNDTDEGILTKVYRSDAESIAKKDADIKQKLDEIAELDPTSENYGELLENAASVLVSAIPEANRLSLTHYVARRKIVLDLFGDILKRYLSQDFASDGPKIDEKLFHNLIFRQSSNEPETSDLWLMNEEFVYFQGASEARLTDLEYEGKKVLTETMSPEQEAYCKAEMERRDWKRPDILLFPNEGKCIIIEFKHPDTNVSDHLDKIAKYAAWIRNLSSDEFNFDTFYGYLIGQRISADDVLDADTDFKHSVQFDYLFRPAKTVLGRFGREPGSLYMEVLTYSSLLERAMARNKIFLDKIKSHQVTEKAKAAQQAPPLLLRS